jgi:hypothetical protein
MKAKTVQTQTAKIQNQSSKLEREKSGKTNFSKCRKRGILKITYKTKFQKWAQKPTKVGRFQTAENAN